LFSSDAGRFFGVVLSDLASLGYSVGWCCYGAVDVGALHRRDRVFIVAYRKECRLQRGSDTRNGSRNDRERLRAELARSGAVGFNQPLAYPSITGLERAITEGATSTDGQPEQCGIPNTDSSRLEEPRRLNADLSIRPSGEPIPVKERRSTQPRMGMLADGFSGWLAEPDIPRVATGVKDRVNKLKALGNAVVPQQIYPIYKAIVDIENELHD
jgi:DNA (cytosine-5)-methyltransferase 1